MMNEEQERDFFWELENAFAEMETDVRRSLHINGDCRDFCAVIQKWGLCPYQKGENEIE